MKPPEEKALVLLPHKHEWRETVMGCGDFPPRFECWCGADGDDQEPPVWSAVWP